MSYFLPYQAAWRRDDARLKICVKARQIGLSHVDGYDSVCRAALRGGKDVWVVSRDELQAKEYIRRCCGWARLLGLAAREYDELLLTPSGARPACAKAITFASGASVRALSSNPDAIAGKTGHVKLDEFALHRDQRTLYAVAKPVTQWGGSLSIISTHRGAHSVFNQVLREIKEKGNPMGWSLHEIPITLAVEQGLVERINAKSGRAELREDWLARQRAECIDEEQWLQEYCCVPADESSAFLPASQIDACIEPGCLRTFDELTATAGPLYLGVDVARKKDLCVLDVGEKIGDVVWDRLRLEFNNQPFATLRAELFRLLALPQLKRCCLDATGLGMQLAEEARAHFGWKVEPIIFTRAVKEELAFGLRTDLEARRLRLPDDPKLRADLLSLKKEVGLGGNIRFTGETDESHCDRTWAKALRQYAARGRCRSGVGAAVG